MRVLAKNIVARAVFLARAGRRNFSLQKSCFSCRLDGAQRFLSCCLHGLFLDQSFKVSLRNVWVFWL